MSTTVSNHEFQVVLNHVYGDYVTASRIVAGALWLDQVDGPWWTNVNLDTFDITNPSRCVLGQVVLGECNNPELLQEYTSRAPFYRATYENIHEYQENRPHLGDAVKYAVPADVAKAMGFHLLNHEDEEWSVKMNRGWYALIAYRQGREDTVFPEEQAGELDD